MPFATTVKGLVIIYYNYNLCGKFFQHVYSLVFMKNVMQSNLVNNGYYVDHINKLSVLSRLNLERD